MVYKIIKIQEADFGCEERPEGSPLMAHVTFESLAGDRFSKEIEDALLTEKGLEEGKYAYFTADNGLMKAVRVVAAVIKSVDAQGRQIIFATQRGYGDFKGGWEFPGGKIEAGETPKEALFREIREELDTEVKVGELIDTIEYDYPTFHLSMDCFWCEIDKGNLVLKEHEAARWVDLETIDEVEWLPADITLIDKVKKGL